MFPVDTKEPKTNRRNVDVSLRNELERVLIESFSSLRGFGKHNSSDIFFRKTIEL